jgi:4-hydroxyphenylacetate 3-monooxygenase
MKLFKLAWDLLGSDFAGRHLQYEKFYGGPGFVMNSYSYFAGPWKKWTETVDHLMASYEGGPMCNGFENRCGASTSKTIKALGL